jgi:hypothetical protein
VPARPVPLFSLRGAIYVWKLTASTKLLTGSENTPLLPAIVVTVSAPLSPNFVTEIEVTLEGNVNVNVSFVGAISVFVEGDHC